MWPTPVQYDATPGGPNNHYKGLGHQAKHGALNQSTSSAGASPASPSATPGSARAQTTPGGSGLGSPVSFGKFGPDGSLLRTCQGFSQSMLDGSFEEFSGTFPRAGTMRSGIVYRQAPSAPRTYWTGSSSWRTPTQGMLNADRAVDPEYGVRKAARGQTITLADQVRWPTPQAYSHGPDSNPPGITKLDIEVRGMWPTPQAHDTSPGNPARVGRFGTKHGGRNLNDEVVYRTPQARDGDQRGPSSPERRQEQGHSVSLHDQVGGQLNPTWVEWLMGFPLGFTDLGDSATPSSRKSRSTSGG